MTPLGTRSRELGKRSIQAARSLRARVLCRRKIDSIFRHNKGLREYARKLNKDEIRPVQAYWERLGLWAETKWHVAYSWLDGRLDPRRIPEDVFYTWVEPRLNRMDLAQAYSDKNAYDTILPGLRTPEAVLRSISGRYFLPDYRPVDARRAVEIVASRGGEEYIIKPALYSGGGKKIGIIDDACGSAEQVAGLFQAYGQDFVVQRRIEQHEGTKAFHPSSVNTLRPLTLRLGGRVVLASCVFRTGNSNSRVDNQSAGGIACQVDERGLLKPYGMDKYLNRYERHPATGKGFGCEIPSVREAVSMVLAAHERLPHFDLVSWDVAIDHSGDPILVELNVVDQEINFHQAGGVSLFGEHTEDLVRELAQRTPTMSLALW